MRIASLLSIFTSGSASAVPSGSFDGVFQTAISDATQRQGSNGQAADDAKAPASGSAASSSLAQGNDEVEPTISGATSVFAAVPVISGNRASGTATAVPPSDTAVVGHPSQPPQKSLSQAAAAAPKESVAGAGTHGKKSGGSGSGPSNNLSSTALRATSYSTTMQTVVPVTFHSSTAVGDRLSAHADSTAIAIPIATIPQPAVAEVSLPDGASIAETHTVAASSAQVLSEPSSTGSFGAGSPVVSQSTTSLMPGWSQSEGDVPATAAAATVTEMTASPLTQGALHEQQTASQDYVERSPGPSVTPDQDSSRGLQDQAGAITSRPAESVDGVVVPAQANAVPAPGGDKTGARKIANGAAAAAQPSGGTTPVAVAASAGAQVAGDSTVPLVGAGALNGLVQPLAASGLPNFAEQPGSLPVVRPVDSKGSDSTAAGDAAKSKGADTVGGASNSPTSSNQVSSQSAQHVATDTSASSAATQRVPDSQTVQTQPVAMHVASHDAAAGARTTDGGAEATQSGSTAPHAEVEDAVPASGINAARVIQAMGGTEMRVGMHSTEFGDISIRTSVSPQQMLTQISVDHSDLSSAISAHASVVQARFQEQYGMQASIEVNQQSASSSGEHGGFQQREQQGFVRSAQVESVGTTDETEIGLGQLAIAGASASYRLDIRA